MPRSLFFETQRIEVESLQVRASWERTCEAARRLLYCLAVANPRHTLGVYKGVVALFSSGLPIVQRMAANTVRRLQSTIGSVIFSILDPLYDLLKSLSVDVQVRPEKNHLGLGDKLAPYQRRIPRFKQCDITRSRDWQ